MKKFLSAIVIAAMTMSFAACNPASTDEGQVPDNQVEDVNQDEDGGNDTTKEDVDDEGKEEDEGNNSTGSKDLSNFSTGMITDVGGVSDQSFNQSAWEGLEKLRDVTGADVNYLESQQESHYGPNIDNMIDMDKDVIWGIGYLMADAVLNGANTNPDQLFAIIDNDFNDGAVAPDNTIGVVFRAEEPSFLVGYMAGLVTETDQVGYIGGIKSPTIDQFEYGYLAGVKYAANELGKEIDVNVQYAESFSDSAIGKAIATTMYSTGCDIVFHAAGNVGQGVIETAKDMNKLVIGVDRDQSDLAPENVMTSALKLVGEAMYETCIRIAEGEDLGGKTIDFGIKEGAAGISPYEGSTADLVSRDVYDKTIEVQDKIMNGEIKVPSNEEDYEAFLDSLEG